MATPIYPRTIVERAPNHTNQPCYTCWEFDALSPDQQPTSSDRPKYSTQFYDITPQADNDEHIRDMVQKLETQTRDHRAHPSCSEPDRFGLYGLPLPIDMPDEERVKRCIAHNLAEVAARNATGASDFYIACTGPWERRWFRRRMLLVIDKPEESWNEGGENDGGFLWVHFDYAERLPEGHSDPEWLRFKLDAIVQEDGGPCGLTEKLRYFYDCYVPEGHMDREIDDAKRRADGTTQLGTM